MADGGRIDPWGPARGPRHARPEPDASLERPFSLADITAICGAARTLVDTHDAGHAPVADPWVRSAVAILRELAR